MTGMERIEALRGSIDGLDRQIIELLAQRTAIVMELTEHKRDEATVRSPGRVEQVIDKVRRIATEHGMPPGVAEGTYRALIHELTELQLVRLAERKAAGLLGPEPDAEPAGIEPAGTGPAAEAAGTAQPAREGAA
ncbi:chorismate mutase [Streptomyces sp. 796.1]|uniref:chorismate mutase n=1 Tax=Streptomyces sp. 796.1 TaxID=3163029 RepID=UPI0039C9F618